MDPKISTLSLWQKNKSYLVWVILFLIIVLVIMASNTGLETAKEDVDSSSNLTLTEEEGALASNQEQTASVLNAVGVGKGEVVFILSSKVGAIVREIQLHNPYKDTWVVVYDGYKSISDIPTEVFRASLAAIAYDKIQVRTLDNFYPLEGMSVSAGQSITVNLDF